MSARAPLGQIPQEVEAIVARLLAKDAGARFADARELTLALDEATAQLTASGRIGVVPAPPSLFGPRGSSPGVSIPDASGPRSALASASNLVTQTPGPPGGAPSGLASLVGGSWGGALKAAPAWMTRRVALACALVLAALVVGALIATMQGKGGAATASPSSTGSARSLPSDPKADEIVSAARSKIEKGDFASAIEELSPLEQRDPRRADVHALLERAFTSVHNARDAMREAGLWLAADPLAAADLKLEEDVRNAALMRDAQDEALALLDSKMGMRGVDLLYDIAFGSSGKLYPQAATRAKHELDVEDVRKRASAALEVALAFRDAKTCDQRHALLADVRDKGDARMLPLLQPFESTRGCGFFGRFDCHPCMRKDHDLADAVQTLQDRQPKAP